MANPRDPLETLLLWSEQALRKTTQVLGAVTGLPYVAKEQRVTERSVWCIWDADVQVRYALSVEPSGWRRYRVAVATQLGPSNAEPRLEAELDQTQVDRLLNDAYQLVRIMVGQQRWAG